MATEAGQTGGRMVEEGDGDVGFLGDVSAKQCWEALQSNKNAMLIDVRTQPEWVFSGLPNLASLDKQVLALSWKHYPTMEVNPHFVDQLLQQVPNHTVSLYFICKTGGRSTDAALAAAAAGYTHCYNVASGFEGDRDAQRHRGKINGWKADNLPWEQA